MREIDVIVDLQFGSTGKGLFAGYLALKKDHDTIATAWGPNAGHTFISSGGVRMVNIALPNGIVSPTVKRVLLGPGSVIEPGRLQEEIHEYRDLLRDIQIMIHPAAVVVMEKDREKERGYGFVVGSTMKGVGEAMQRKIARFEACTAGQGAISAALKPYVVTRLEYMNALAESQSLLIEGAQGYSLSINHGFYPHTTSRDCTVQQLLVDCGIPMKMWNHALSVVYGVARTYPIRVANRFKDCSACNGGRSTAHKGPCVCCGGTNKVQVGTSGPCYPDQRELQWEELGLEPELTTVTKLPRRIFTFSEQQLQEAVHVNDVDYIFLNFCNYPGVDLDAIRDIIQTTSAELSHTGWGPKVSDVREE